MHARVVPAGSLSAPERARWSAIQQSVESLASPFFCPQFTGIVAGSRDDAYVAVLEEGGEAQGFFPFQRGRFGVGYPIGSVLSDYHGVIAPQGAMPLGVRQLTADCGLKVWEFHHLVAWQAASERSAHLARESRVMELSAGFDAYVSGRRQEGHGTLGEIARKARKLEREHGELHFNHDSSDVGQLEALMSWKSAQYRRTGAPDVLARPWITEVLRRVHATETAPFAGILSTLHAGDRLVAVHLGMRSDSIWHYWFPAYDPSFARYSPGLILLLRMAACAPALGLRSIDLGAGDARYKLTLSNAQVDLVAGAMETPSLVAGALRTRRAARAVLRRSSLAHELRRGLYRARRAGG